MAAREAGGDARSSPCYPPACPQRARPEGGQPPTPPRIRRTVEKEKRRKEECPRAERGAVPRHRRKGIPLPGAGCPRYPGFPGMAAVREANRPSCHTISAESRAASAPKAGLHPTSALLNNAASEGRRPVTATISPCCFHSSISCCFSSGARREKTRPLSAAAVSSSSPETAVSSGEVRMPSRPAGRLSGGLRIAP